MSTLLQVKGSGPYEVREQNEPIAGYVSMSRAEYAALAAAYVPPPEPVSAPVPQSVTPLQMRRALRATGLKATVDAALAAASDEVREEWEYATEILRDNATLEAMGHALGKTDAEIDALFQLAATF